MQRANRAASWVLALAIVGLISYQQFLINRHKRNESYASVENAKLAKSNVQLRARLEVP